MDAIEEIKEKFVDVLVQVMLDSNFGEDDVEEQKKNMRNFLNNQDKVTSMHQMLVDAEVKLKAFDEYKKKLETEIQSTKRELGAAKETVSTNLEKLESCEKKNKDLKTRETALLAVILKKEAGIKQLQGNLSELKTRFKTTYRDINTLNTEKNKLLEENRKIQETKQKLEKGIKGIEEKLEAANKTISENRKELEKGENEKSRLTSLLAESEKKEERLKETLNKSNAELEKKYKNINTQNGDLQREKNGLLKGISNLKKENEDLKTQLKNIGVDGLNKRIKELEQQKRKDVNELQSAYRHPQMNTSTFSSFFF